MQPDCAMLLIVAAIVLVPLVYAVMTYNRLVRLRQYLRESWADIDVELKRRHDLIPNLVETVKGYAAHERQVLERLVELRNQAESDRSPAKASADSPRSIISSSPTTPSASPRGSRGETSLKMSY